MLNEPLYIVIDLFCGAGGTSTGFAQAQRDGRRLAEVIACVNHDAKAIRSHASNYPNVKHFTEDIRSMDLNGLQQLTRKYRLMYPDAYIVLWASLECTNFSKAKGGMSRDADSRTLAQSLHMLYNAEKEIYYKGDSYVQLLQPDYIMIENVVEFMAWGPMRIKAAKKHKDRTDLKMIFNKKKQRWEYGWEPISKKNGEDYLHWCRDICSYGYKQEWKEINSANLGAHTSRNRLFGCFARPHLPIIFPKATHAKVEKRRKRDAVDMFGSTLAPWKPVREVLDFSNEGHSIFNRTENMELRKQDRKELVEASLRRYYEGCVKHIADGDRSFEQYEHLITGSHIPFGKVNAANQKHFLTKQLSNNAKTGTNSGASVDQPYPAVTTQAGRITITSAHFLSQYNGGAPEGRSSDITEPCKVLTTENRHALISAPFIVQCYSGDPKGMVASVDNPARTLTATGGNQQLVQPCFIGTYYSTGDNTHSIEGAAPTLRCKDGVYVINCKHFLDKSYTGPSNHQSVHEPAGALVNKDHYNLITPGFIHRDFSNGGHGNSSGLNEPVGSIPAVPKVNFVKAEPFIIDTNYGNASHSIDVPARTITASRKHHLLINPQYDNKGASVDQPCFTLIAKMDKRPPLLIQLESGDYAIQVFETDSYWTRKLKLFMAAYGIIDIKMRMLVVPELLKIQGFPDDYVLQGSQADQKKFIGNSVVPLVVKCWMEDLAAPLLERRQMRKIA